MKQKILGIIGGLGPETSTNFCLNINLKVKAMTNIQPHILLDNLPISQKSESMLITGGVSQEHLKLLEESVLRIQSNVDFIVIPCNTVHIFLDKLRSISSVPIISIIESTAIKCKNLGFEKVGLLASTKTVNENLHGKLLKKENIDLILPNISNQNFISECILRIINKKCTPKDKKIILEIIQDLANRGAKGVILGCSDLYLLLDEISVNVPLINTTQVLEEITIKTIIS